VKLTTDPQLGGRYAGIQLVSSLNHEPFPADQQLQCALATCGGITRGQAAVEFALVLSVGLIILVVAIQMALVGETALALGQVNYQGARYAAIHQCATASDVAAYMTSVASPTLVGSNCGGNMVVTLTDVNGSNSSSGSCASPGCDGTPRTFGSQVTVSVVYTIPSSQMFLPNPFLGISFPTSLSSSEAAMSE
jgi:Flp pilus assembly protein TadG